MQQHQHDAGETFTCEGVSGRTGVGPCTAFDHRLLLCPRVPHCIAGSCLPSSELPGRAALAPKPTRPPTVCRAEVLLFVPRVHQTKARRRIGGARAGQALVQQVANQALRPSTVAAGAGPAGSQGGRAREEGASCEPAMPACVACRRTRRPLSAPAAPRSQARTCTVPLSTVPSPSCASTHSRE